jgi:hypothetical protein
MKKILLCAGLLVAGQVAPAPAQTANEIQTYLAISRTPVGALSPMLTSTLIDRAQNGASLVVRYGNLARGDFNNSANAFGVTGIMPAGLGSSLRLTGGVVMPDRNSPLLADQPSGELMLGVGGDIRLIGSTMGTTATAPLWTVSLDGELGYGKLDPGTAISGYVGIPIALVPRGQGMQFVPFITPAFAFAQASEGGSSSSGSGLMLGGGLGIYNSESSVIINVGAQHSFINGARNVIGINLLLGGK